MNIFFFSILGYLSDLIDDEEIEEDDISMYHRLDNQMDIEEREEEEEEEEEEKDDKKRGFIYPLRVTSQELSRHVNLLLTEQDGSWHYSTIKNFNGFFRAQYSKHCGKTFYCYSCLHRFQAKPNEKTRQDCVLLQEHVQYCKQEKSQRVSYPQKKVVEFTNIHSSDTMILNVF